MRIREVVYSDVGVDKFIMLLRNEIGNYARKRSPARLNWANIAQMSMKAGFEFLSDPKNGYETFKSIYDTNPTVQGLVKNFNDRGLELNVPGVPDGDAQGDGTQSATDSQAAVDKAAATAAPQQLAAQA